MGQRSAGEIFITTTPMWAGFEPYGDKAACWGCGLTPDFSKRDGMTGRQWHLCGWCDELLTVDRCNQRRQSGRAR